MALTTHTVTLRTEYPGGDPLDGTWSTSVYAFPPLVKDLDGHVVIAGKDPEPTIEGTGELVLTLEATGQADLDPPDFLWQISFVSRDRATRLGPYVFDLTEDRTLDDIAESTGMPITPTLLSQTIAARDEAVAIAADLADLPTLDELEDTFAYKTGRVSDLVPPIYIGHRGAANLYPENTLEGIEAAVGLGIQAVELGDVHLLVDGNLATMHDFTVDRTTTGTGNVTDNSTVGIKNLTVDAGTWFGGGWGNLKVPMWQEILDRVGGKIAGFPESKSGAGPRMATVITQAGLQESIVVNTFDWAEAGALAAAGIQTCYLDATGTTHTPTEIAAAGIEWVAVDQAVTAPTVAALKAAGLKVLAYTPNRRVERDALVAKGITDGFFTDEPVYLNGSNTHRRTTDPFKGQTWYHGHLADSARTDKGSFTAPADWGYTTATELFYRGCLQGWACPIADAAGTYQINLSVIFDALNAGDTTRWASVFCAMPTDRHYTNAGVAGEDGYHILFRGSGGLDLYKVTNGAVSLLANKTAGITAPVLGTTVAQYQISFTPTTINVARLDVPYALAAPFADATHRGGYFQLGRNGAAVRFRGVSIT